MAKEYHKYIFDVEKRKFVGEFETMYAKEDTEGFDSWSQDTLNSFSRRIALAILDGYNFNRILDLGCGKGSFTHLLKKENNQVIGVDLSSTAIQKARIRYPNLLWAQGRAEELESLLDASHWTHASLLVAFELLSYIEDWPDSLRKWSLRFGYIFISLFLPENPVGFVKSAAELSQELEKHYEPICDLYFQKNRVVYWFGRSRNCSGENVNG